MDEAAGAHLGLTVDLIDHVESGPSVMASTTVGTARLLRQALTRYLTWLEI